MQMILEPGIAGAGSNSMMAVSSSCRAMPDTVPGAGRGHP